MFHILTYEYMSFGVRPDVCVDTRTHVNSSCRNPPQAAY